LDKLSRRLYILFSAVDTWNERLAEQNIRAVFSQIAGISQNVCVAKAGVFSMSFLIYNLEVKIKGM
jgi:hypothetical protein